MANNMVHDMDPNFWSGNIDSSLDPGSSGSCCKLNLNQSNVRLASKRNVFLEF